MLQCSRIRFVVAFFIWKKNLSSLPIGCTREWRMVSGEPVPDGRNGIIFLPNTGPMDSLTTLHRELILACLDDEPGRARGEKPRWTNKACIWYRLLDRRTPSLCPQSCNRNRKNRLSRVNVHQIEPDMAQSLVLPRPQELKLPAGINLKNTCPSNWISAAGPTFDTLSREHQHGLVPK